MLIENQFEVKAGVDELWAYLLDVERIAPCMPGAELTETVDDRTWKGRVKMKFGPMAMTFAGTVTIQERDDAAHRVMLKAQGQESKGKGAARAEVSSWLEPGDGMTTVKMQADIVLTGAVAQMSRGLIPDISARLTQEFADCLQASMASAGASERAEGGGGAAPLASPSPTPLRDTAPADRGAAGTPIAAAKPVGGLRLGLWALVRAIGRGFSKLFGRKPPA